MLTWTDVASSIPVLFGVGSLIYGIQTHRKNLRLQKDLEKADRKNDYVSMASHEVKNLAFHMSTSAEMIRKSFDVPPLNSSEMQGSETVQLVKADASRLYSASKTLANFVFELLEVGKMKNIDNLPIVRSRLNLTNSVADVFKIFKHQIREKSLETEYVRIGCSDRDVYVNTDTIRVKQILLNLVGNSVKYTDQGKIKVTVDVTEPSSFLLIVEDTGMGIPKRDMRSILRKYYRASNTKGREGTGVGLSTVFALAKSLGGGVSIESHEGLGTKVTVQLSRDSWEP